MRMEKVLELSLPPRSAVKTAVVNGLGDVLFADLFGASKVGDGTSDLEDAVIGSCRKIQALHGKTELLQPFGIRASKELHKPWGHLRIAVYLGIGGEALSLYLACG